MTANVYAQVCGKLLGANISDDNLFFLLDIVDKYDCSCVFPLDAL